MNNSCLTTTFQLLKSLQVDLEDLNRYVTTWFKLVVFHGIANFSRLILLVFASTEMLDNKVPNVLC